MKPAWRAPNSAPAPPKFQASRLHWQGGFFALSAGGAPALARASAPAAPRRGANARSPHGQTAGRRSPEARLWQRRVRADAALRFERSLAPWLRLCAWRSRVLRAGGPWPTIRGGLCPYVLKSLRGLPGRASRPRARAASKIAIRRLADAFLASLLNWAANLGGRTVELLAGQHGAPGKGVQAGAPAMRILGREQSACPAPCRPANIDDEA